MKLSSFILLMALTFLVPLAACAEEPPLSKLTCREFWEYHKRINDVKSPDKEKNSEKYFTEIINAWNFNVKKFQEKHPELTHPIITDSSAYEELRKNNKNYIIMYFYTACKNRPENALKILGENLQKKFYEMAVLEGQNQKAKENDCKLSSPRSIKIFYPEREGFLVACMNKGRSSRISANSDSQKGSVGVSVCNKPWDRNTEPECQIIEPIQENVCLSRFGVCSKNEEGQCGWSHTDESRECLNKTKFQ